MNTKLTPRLLTEADINVRELSGYYIKRMYEYAPLGLGLCITLRRWNEAGGIDPGDATRQALAYFNERIQTMARHIGSLCP